MNNATNSPRSELVTIVAWMNMVLCGLSALACAALMALFATLVPMDEILSAIQTTEGQQGIPASALFAISHIQALLGISLGLSLVMLFASFALLKRKNWARLFWIACMAVIVVWCVVGLFFPPDLASLMPSELSAAPPETQAQIQQTMMTVKIWGYVVSIVQAALFSWLIWRFVSPDIRQEFKQAH